MTILTTDKALKQYCKTLSKAPYITVDTEFLRDKTYYAKLCLIQVSDPKKNAVAIDVIANPDLDLTPLLDIFKNKKISKVFHAGRQDLEIFWQQYETLPTPLYDTQIAAMVCGYGDQIGFDNLSQKAIGKRLDKSQQFTDWSRRPLSEKQLSYALDDVLYLVDIYEHLVKELDKRGRTSWVLEETEALLEPDLYDLPLDDIWQRLKVKSPRPKQLAVLRELAAWREKRAQEVDIPRGRILRDDILVDISFHPPAKPKDLQRVRGFPKGQEDKKLGLAIIEAAQKGVNSPKANWPEVEKKKILPPHCQPALEMLKMLLKIKAAENDVAARLIASNDDLQALAEFGEQAKTTALKGWRKKIFGDDALKMLSGKIVLQLHKNQVKLKSI